MQTDDPDHGPEPDSVQAGQMVRSAAGRVKQPLGVGVAGKAQQQLGAQASFRSYIMQKCLLQIWVSLKDVICTVHTCFFRRPEDSFDIQYCSHQHQSAKY